MAYFKWLGTIDAISLVDCSHGRNQSISVGSVIFGNFGPIFTTIKSNSLVHFENCVFSDMSAIICRFDVGIHFIWSKTIQASFPLLAIFYDCF